MKLIKRFIDYVTKPPANPTYESVMKFFNTVQPNEINSILIEISDLFIVKAITYAILIDPNNYRHYSSQRHVFVPKNKFVWGVENLLDQDDWQLLANSKVKCQLEIKIHFDDKRFKDSINDYELEDSLEEAIGRIGDIFPFKNSEYFRDLDRGPGSYSGYNDKNAEASAKLFFQF